MEGETNISGKSDSCDFAQSCVLVLRRALAKDKQQIK